MSKLSEYVEVIPGYPFRERILESPDGDARVLQMKDVDPSSGVAWGGLLKTNLKGRRKPDWLRADDVVFLLRGNRNFALILKDVPGPTVISPHFFHLRVGKQVPLLPDFLAWQINQERAQRYLEMSAEGTVQRSIRRGVLEGMPFVLPPIQEQELIVRLARAAKSEADTHRNLIANREQMLRAVASKILGQDNSTRR